MRRTRKRRAAVVLLTACVFGGGLAPPLEGHERHDEFEHTTLTASSTATSAVAMAAAAASSGLGCPQNISCGSGCSAYLGSGYCVRLVKGQTSNIFGFQVGLECKACDCMYVAPGPNGQVLVRKVEVGCDVNFDGLELY